MKFFNLITKTVFVFIILFLCFYKHVFAQEVGLSITPPHIEILMKPATSLLQAYEIKNTGDRVVLYTRVVSFEPVGDEGSRIFKDKAEGPLRFSLENSDMKLDDKFVLERGEKFQVLLKIRAINKAPEGDYYYAVLFTTQPPVTQQSSGKGRAVIGANILISVSESGLYAGEAHIAQFQIIPRYEFSLFGTKYYFIESYDEVPVVLKIANTGAHLVVPESVIRLRGPFGINHKKKLLPLNVLRRSERIMLEEGETICKRCTRVVSTVFNGFFLGKYTVTADVEYGGSNKKQFASMEFWAFPIRLLQWLILLLSVSFLIWLALKTKIFNKS